MKYADPVITERYARALFRAAEKMELVDRVFADIEMLRPLLGIQSKLQLFLDSPQLTTEVKRDLIDRVLRPRVAPITAQLFHILLTKGRTEYAIPIFLRFKKLAREARGIREATLVTAVALGDGERARLQAALESYLAAHLEVSFVVDPRVIGGVRFQCGDLLLDGSVQGKLSRLRERLEAVVNR